MYEDGKKLILTKMYEVFFLLVSILSLVRLHVTLSEGTNNV